MNVFIFTIIYLLIGAFWALILKEAIKKEGGKDNYYLSIFLWPLDILIDIYFDLRDRIHDMIYPPKKKK